MDDWGLIWNTVSSNKADGVAIWNDDTMTSTLILGNTIEANSGSAAAIIPVNVPTFPTGDGIFIYNTGVMSTVEFSGNDISHNAGTGIDIVNDPSTMQYFSFEDNVITHNGGAGVSLEGSGFANVDLGTASPESNGFNAIYGNGSYDIVNDTDITTIDAQNNYWGGGAGSFGGTNTVSAEPYLTQEAIAP